MRDTEGMVLHPHSRRPLARLMLALLFCASATHAQPPVAEVLRALETSANSVIDLAFTLDGVLVDEGGQTLRVEVEVLAIPSLPALALYILRPDAIADNQIVVDGDVVRSYTFITNQTTLFDLSDPDAFGGLIQVDANGNLPLSLDLGAVFAGWEAQVVGEETVAGAAALVVRFDNLDPNAAIQRAVATVFTGGWNPWRLELYRAGDVLLADLTFKDLKRDQGLTRADVVYLPEDAEVLDRRKR
jgi:outer membrane lipoprotein-sorting protein